MPEAYPVADAMSEKPSAVIVRLRLPAGLERLRRARDRSASHGVPAHVTILYPFLPQSDLTGTVRGELASIAREIRAFDVRFSTVARWPGVVYLEPEPRAPFRAMIDRVVARWPDHPPYDGAVDEVIPHLTIAEHDDPLDDVLAAVPGFLPFEAPATGLEVLAETGEGRWRSRWRLPFRS
jgi:2'-5' RNA ligase